MYIVLSSAITTPYQLYYALIRILIVLLPLNMLSCSCSSSHNLLTHLLPKLCGTMIGIPSLARSPPTFVIVP